MTRALTVRDRIESEIAIGHAAAEATAELLRTKSRPWYEAGGQPLSDEPAIQLAAGRVAVDLATAEAALAAAATPAALAMARGLAGEASLRAASHLFEAAGTTSADDPADFGRYWQQLRCSTVEDPLPATLVAAARAFLDDPEEPQPDMPLLRQARSFARSLAEGAAARDRMEGFAHEALAALSTSGLLAANVPPAFGGHGAGFTTAVEISRILSVADGSIGQISTIHYSITEQLVRLATPDQKARWLSAVARGARFGNAAAERGVAHAKITETRLDPEGPGRFRLNGRKYYSTGAPDAAMIAVLARDPSGDLVTALVAQGSPGLTILDDWRALGQRGTGSGTTILDGVAVTSADILPRWINADAPTTATAAANLPHVALDLGLARGAIEAIAARLPASPDERVLYQFGKLAARLFGGEALYRAALARLPAVEAEGLTDESVRRFSLQVSIAKAQAADLALDAGEQLFDILGAAALDPQAGLDRFWRDARTHTLHDPTRWRLIHIGNHLLTGRLPPRNRTN